MKFAFISPDAQGRIDPVANDTLYKHMEQVRRISDADVVAIPVSYYGDFKFDPQRLLGIKKPLVVFDYLEYYNTWEGYDSHILGQDTDVPRCILDNPEWEKLSKWLMGHPPVAYFKRELLAKDRAPRVHPLEFTCILPAPPIDTEEQWRARPLEVFHSWGYSNVARPRLHADIFNGMNTHGLGVVAHWDQFDGYLREPHPARSWASIFSPHYVRQDINAVVLPKQLLARISVSLPGAGTKCFRHGEAPVGTIMALPFDQLAWSHPWVSGHNCVHLPAGQLFEALEVFGGNSANLYPIYLAGQENANKYRPQNYIAGYLVPTILGNL